MANAQNTFHLIGELKEPIVLRKPPASYQDKAQAFIVCTVPRTKGESVDIALLKDISYESFSTYGLGFLAHIPVGATITITGYLDIEPSTHTLCPKAESVYKLFDGNFNFAQAYDEPSSKNDEEKKLPIINHSTQTALYPSVDQSLDTLSYLRHLRDF